MGKCLADPQHHVLRVVPPPRRAPSLELLGKVGGRLSGERRVGGADAFAGVPVAGGAWRQATRRVSAMVEGGRFCALRCPGWRLRHKGHVRIICGDRILLCGGQLACDPLHFGVLPPAARISLQLRRHIAAIKPGKAWSPGAIAATVRAVAGHAGPRRAGVPATQRDELAGGREGVRRAAVDTAARRQPESGGADHGDVA